ncbi:hypothetical protein MHU86_10576 [Fragilaria crotonensis]|nr:hypothetical protein MHU86_10576 [Fragilaria crotonensis]
MVRLNAFLFRVLPKMLRKNIFFSRVLPKMMRKNIFFFCFLPKMMRQRVLQSPHLLEQQNQKTVPRDHPQPQRWQQPQPQQQQQQQQQPPRAPQPMRKPQQLLRLHRLRQQRLQKQKQRSLMDLDSDDDDNTSSDESSYGKRRRLEVSDNEELWSDIGESSSSDDSSEELESDDATAYSIHIVVAKDNALELATHQESSSIKSGPAEEKNDEGTIPDTSDLIASSCFTITIGRELLGTYIDTRDAFCQVLHAFTLGERDLNCVCGHLENAKNELSHL